MALIKCPDCGRDVSDQAPACINCGRLLKAVQAQSRGPLQWEYKDLTIPLGDMSDENGTRGIERVMLDHIQREGALGWQAEGPTDISSLWHNGRLQCERKLSGGYTYQSATIRLKRVAESSPQSAPTPHSTSSTTLAQPSHAPTHSSPARESATRSHGRSIILVLLLITLAGATLLLMMPLWSRVDLATVPPTDQGIDFTNALAANVYPLKVLSRDVYITSNGQQVYVDGDGTRITRPYNPVDDLMLSIGHWRRTLTTQGRTQ